MFKLNFSEKPDSIYKVLCLSFHCDDIEIGCGGTILRLIENYPNIVFHWVVFGSDPQKEREAYESANRLLKNAKAKDILIKNFRDGFFIFIGSEIKEWFEQLKQNFSPNIIFTHYRNDLHQDHRLIYDLTWNTFKNH